MRLGLLWGKVVLSYFFQPEEAMLWISYFWQLPGGSPLEGFVSVFDKDIFEEKDLKFESFSSS